MGKKSVADVPLDDSGVDCRDHSFASTGPDATNTGVSISDSESGAAELACSVRRPFRSVSASCAGTAPSAAKPRVNTTTNPVEGAGSDCNDATAAREERHRVSTSWVAGQCSLPNAARAHASCPGRYETQGVHKNRGCWVRLQFTADAASRQNCFRSWK